MTVAVFGRANMDLVIEVPRSGGRSDRHRHGFTTVLGGKGLNQAVAAARLGTRSAFVGRVGDDAHGRELCHGLAAGVDVGALRVDPAAGPGLP